MLRSLVLVCLALSAAADIIADCPRECKCVWARGNQQANCSHANLQKIPRTLSAEIQNLDLTGNNLSEVTRHAFEDVGLINLKRLILRDCKLLTIHKNGLSGLAIMIELDLSKNQLKELQPDTFKETVEIMSILLNDNLLEKLDDGLFNNLPFLMKVDLSNNRIKQVGVKTFLNVPNLRSLNLECNKLESMDADAVSSLYLYKLGVHDNPWRCDCNLEDFINWVINKKLDVVPIACSKPANLEGKLWRDLHSSDFACRPSTVDQTASDTFQSSGTNITLSCQVNGNNLPKVNWVLNAEITDGNYLHEGELKYYITQSRHEKRKFVNLTIIYAEPSGNGE